MVAAPGMAQVVRFAGGWLFDQVMAGWDVTVLTADHADTRPLRILGASSVHLECALPLLARGLRPHAVAACADLYGSDARVRMMVLEALGKGTADVRLWGDRWPPDLDGAAASVPHRLSVAARAFKAQALAAVAAPVQASDVTEVFLRGEKPSLSASASSWYP